MSDYESHSGKLRLLKKHEDETFEEQCQRLWVENGKEIEDYEEDEFFDEFYEKYIEFNEEIYEIFDHKDLGDEDMFCRISKNADGTFSFHTRFYNGGTCLSEMINDGLEEIDEK